MAIWLMTISPPFFSLFYWHPFLFPPSPLPRPVKNSGRQTGRCFIHPGATSGMFPPGHRPDHAGKTASGMRIFPGYGSKDFPAWREKVRKAMQQLMKFPPQADIPAPVLVKTVPREHYRVEKWEAYPFPGAAVPFLVLLPNNASDKNPVPVLFCIPGSDQTKEELAGETSPDLDQPSVQQPGNNAMAFHYVRQGWAAIVVDNAGTGEEGDAEHAAGRSSHDYENLARLPAGNGLELAGLHLLRGPMYSGLGENTPLGAKKPYYPQRLLPGNGTHDGSGSLEPGYLCLRV